MDIRKHFFSDRVVDTLIKLGEYEVNADSIGKFKSLHARNAKFRSFLYTLIGNHAYLHMHEHRKRTSPFERGRRVKPAKPTMFMREKFHW